MVEEDDYLVPILVRFSARCSRGVFSIGGMIFLRRRARLSSAFFAPKYRRFDRILYIERWYSGQYRLFKDWKVTY